MVRQIEKAPFESYDLIRDLQRALVTRIKRTERRLVELKSERKRLSKTLKSGRLARAESEKIRDDTKRLDLAIEEAKHLLFVWRSFGDAIACIYLDTWSLKHMFYSTEDYSARQSAGALSGNAGASNEWRVLLRLLKNQIPAVLCDLTNTLRFGDVCVLVGPDPYPIEVKSSFNSNARTARQASNLKELHDFLRTDAADHFRGLRDVRRVEMQVPAFNLSALNACIERSGTEGYAVEYPEAGLTYLCVRAGAPVPPLQTFGFGDRHLVGCLTESLLASDWMPCRPPIVSIFKPDHVAQFLCGEIFIFVVVDSETTESILARDGLVPIFVDDPQIVCWVTRDRSNEGLEASYSAITKNVFRRIFLEFSSLSGVMRMIVDGHARFEALALNEPVSLETAKSMLAEGSAIEWPPVMKPLFKHRSP
jgi:hypothetical protein